MAELYEFCRLDVLDNGGARSPVAEQWLEYN